MQDVKINMSIFNWKKKKDEERKQQVMEPKKAPSSVSVASEIVEKRPLKSKKAEIDSVATQAVEQAPEVPRATGDAHRVLLRPLITEKNTLHQTQNQYVFEVAIRANKVEVQKAVESAFKVKVKKVRIVRMRGKIKQFGRVKGVRKFWKKAIVSVEKGDHITLLSSV